MSSIYQELILEHYHRPHNYGDMDSADGEISVSNSSCGDKIHIQIEYDGKKVKNIMFSGQGCAISIASASLLTDYAKGKSISHLKTMNSRTMLDLLSIELSPHRLKCALLPLEGLSKLVNKL